MKIFSVRKPHPLLSPWIEYFFICRGEDLAFPSDAGSLKDMPNGNARILYFLFSPDFPDEKGLFSNLLIQGPRTKIQKLPPGMVEVLGAVIRPGGLKAIADVPGHRLTNKLLPLETVWGKESLSLLESMAGAKNSNEKRETLEQSLIRRLKAFTVKDLFVVEAAKIIEAQEGRKNLEEFLQQAGYSRSSVLRKFKDWMGLTPKQYARIVRFQHLFEELDPPQDTDWARAASKHGYFDQSHLAHEFELLTGQYPAKFVRDFRTSASFIPGQARRELILYSKPKTGGTPKNRF